MQSLTVSKPTPLKLQTSGKKRVINSVINYSKNYNQVQKHQTSNSLNQLVFNISKCQNRRTIIRQAEEGVEVDLELEVEEIELDTEESMVIFSAFFFYGEILLDVILKLCQW
eukprot:TRINITY_DN27394_c0_g3_i3.p5 TRINITY_DN27394_c0_g3~~TRINITY_DN27394_c0_g3_i3.p5  ORF type:complete len:112 (+),score=15.27 TRINITY_DN27394_c0_g3_i3:62-397(+)